MGIEQVRGLIERFQTHQAEYTSGAYNEALLRQDFLDPLFEEKRGLAQAERSGDVPVPAFPGGRRI